MHEKWIKNMEDKENQSLTFLDLSAAFDTLSKDIFCEKMKIYGFDDRSVKWFKSYLTDRCQRVMIGSTISEPITLTVGSPQGAILSSTIFILLVSDIRVTRRSGFEIAKFSWQNRTFCRNTQFFRCQKSHLCSNFLT